MQKRKKYLMDIVSYRPLTFVKGNGSHLIDQHGIAYLDFFTDVGTSSMGYNSSSCQEIMKRFTENNIPVHSPNLYHNANREVAAKLLCKRTKMDRVFFCNSGSEAVEAAIKMVRKYHFDKGIDKTTIWSYVGGFHGRTYGALAAGDGPEYHYRGFGPFVPNISHFKDIGEIPQDAAAVLIAPVFGNNDVIVYADGWLKELREYTRNIGALLIFDEVQTGMGRSGDITYAQRIGVEPDIITLGKGIAMGVPAAATLARSGVAEVITPGTHFSTFGGSPLCCVFIEAMLKYLTKGILSKINAKGQYIMNLLSKTPWAKNVRGVGMLIACDVDFDTRKFADECEKRRLLIGAFRTGPGPIKITPPLNISHHDLGYGLYMMDIVAKEMA